MFAKSIQHNATNDDVAIPAAGVVDAVKLYGSGDTAVRALDGVSVQFPAGRFTAIMGPSGSGKSTLLHCIAGLDPLNSGWAFVGGTELGLLTDRQLTELRRERIGFIFQSFNLLPMLTAAENITLPLSLAGKKPDADWMDTIVDRLALGEHRGGSRLAKPRLPSHVPKDAPPHRSACKSWRKVRWSA